MVLNAVMVVLRKNGVVHVEVLVVTPEGLGVLVLISH